MTCDGRPRRPRERGARGRPGCRRWSGRRPGRGSSAAQVAASHQASSRGVPRTGRLPEPTAAAVSSSVDGALERGREAGDDAGRGSRRRHLEGRGAAAGLLDGDRAEGDVAGEPAVVGVVEAGAADRPGTPAPPGRAPAPRRGSAARSVSAPTPCSTPKARTVLGGRAQRVGWIESLSHAQTKLLTLPFQEPRICAGAEAMWSSKDQMIRPSSWSSTQRCAVPRPQRSGAPRVVWAISSRPCGQQRLEFHALIQTSRTQEPRTVLVRGSRLLVRAPERCSGVGALAVVRALLLASAALASGLAHVVLLRRSLREICPEAGVHPLRYAATTRIGRPRWPGPGSVVPGDLDLHLADREHHPLAQPLGGHLACRSARPASSRCARGRSGPGTGRTRRGGAGSRRSRPGPARCRGRRRPDRGPRSSRGPSVASVTGGAR